MINIMINIIGWYAFILAILVGLVCWFQQKQMTTEKKILRAFAWIFHALFLMVAVLAWK